MRMQHLFLWLLIPAVSVLLIGGCAAVSEHPGMEHPAEHPVGRTQAALTTEELAAAIEAYVMEDATLKGGYFIVYDKEANKPLLLSLVRVHKERLSRVGPQVYFACADFKTPEGTVYDLDIFRKGTGRKDLRVTEISVHKEAGKERYTWVEKGGVWEKKPVPGAAEKEEPAQAAPPMEHSAEHP